MVRGREEHREVVHEPAEPSQGKAATPILEAEPAGDQRADDRLRRHGRFQHHDLHGRRHALYVHLPDTDLAGTRALRPGSAGAGPYKSLGCFYCHNQFVRPQDWAMGYESQTGDYYYSVPNFMGTERTGPSLGQIGGKVPTEWHIAHHQDPRSVSPSSIMPPFAFSVQGRAERSGGLSPEPRQRRPGPGFLLGRRCPPSTGTSQTRTRR